MRRKRKGSIAGSRWLQLALLLSLLVLAGGLAMLGDNMVLQVPWSGTEQVMLTGKDRAGRIEVPVLNLWARPGFGPENQVVARFQFPPSGEERAELMAQEEMAGQTWYQVRLSDGATGWVMARFVVE